ncbi:MAG: response regulator [Elusimicrobiota bacterium]
MPDRRVLIIDDDTDLVQLLTTLIASWRYEVASANDPAAGLAVCRDFKPDIILLDYHMPGATGAHLYETLRRNQATARVPILFMSAIACPEKVLSEIADPSLSRFIAKPVQAAELRRIIRTMLETAGT